MSVSRAWPDAFYVRRTFDLHSVSVGQKSFSVTYTFIITSRIFQTEFVYRILTQTSWRRFHLTTGVWFYILIEIALPIFRCLRHVFQIRNVSHHGLQQRLINLSYFISRCKTCLFFIIVRVWHKFDQVSEVVYQTILWHSSVFFFNEFQKFLRLFLFLFYVWFCST